MVNTEQLVIIRLAPPLQEFTDPFLGNTTIFIIKGISAKRTPRTDCCIVSCFLGNGWVGWVVGNPNQPLIQADYYYCPSGFRETETKLSLRPRRNLNQTTNRVHESPKPKHQAPERPNQTLIRPLRDRNQTLHQTTEKLKPNLCYFGYLHIHTDNHKESERNGEWEDTLTIKTF